MITGDWRLPITRIRFKTPRYLMIPNILEKMYFIFSGERVAARTFKMIFGLK